MLRYWSSIAVCGFLVGCANLPQPGAQTPEAPPTCPVPVELPAPLAAQLEPVKDDALLVKSMGPAKQGKLCTGQVFQAKADAQVVLFRAWNSTNPGSRLGPWWAVEKPDGKISDYRRDYEICYQWSPLDMLVQCRLKPGTKVVIGPGQSAECSQYLSYPASPKQQVFIENAESALSDCTNASGIFSWQ